MAKRILLADDSITIQKVVELTFAEGEYEVICANDGAQAIRKIEENPPDIALIDVMMPQRNGYDVCAHVKQDPDLAWIPVLLLTGTFEPFDPRRSEQVGANGHIVKPFESRSLVSQVEQLISKHPRPGSEPAPVPSPGEVEVINSGQVLSAGDTADEIASGPGAQAEDVGPATVRLDSRDFFAQFQGGPPPVEEPEATEAATPSLGPLDLGADTTDFDSTAPVPVQVQPPGESQETDTPTLAREEVEQITRDKIHEMVDSIMNDTVEKIVREVAWEVLPDIAEAMVTRRIRELEDEASAKKGASLN
jgi:CheY-like chemotaxis protein